jgi:hypothetical protein
MLQRQIDDVPTRTELVQYERRFVELYDQVRVAIHWRWRHLSWVLCEILFATVICASYRFRAVR